MNLRNVLEIITFGENDKYRGLQTRGSRCYAPRFVLSGAVSLWQSYRILFNKIGGTFFFHSRFGCFYGHSQECGQNFLGHSAVLWNPAPGQLSGSNQTLDRLPATLSDESHTQRHVLGFRVLHHLK